MPKLSGVFEFFRDLDKINLSHLAKSKGQIKSIENFIGNRILYPQTVPLTKLDLRLDFAILAEGLKDQSQVIYNKWSRKIVIPEDLETRFPTLFDLVKLIIQCINPKGVTDLYLRNKLGSNLIGSIVTPRTLTIEDLGNILVNDKKINLQFGSVAIIPSKERHLSIKIGKNDAVSASGGSLGVLVDLREGNLVR